MKRFGKLLGTTAAAGFLALLLSGTASAQCYDGRGYGGYYGGHHRPGFSIHFGYSQPRRHWGHHHHRPVHRFPHFRHGHFRRHRSCW